MSPDEHITRVLVARLCAALREALACNADPIDPRTIEHLTTIEAWSQGNATDDALARATAALDAVAEEFHGEALESASFHPDYQVANTAWQIGDMAEVWEPSHESPAYGGPRRFHAALEFLEGLCSQNDERDDMPAVGRHLGIEHPAYTDEFDAEAVLRAATEHVHASTRRS